MTTAEKMEKAQRALELVDVICQTLSLVMAELPAECGTSRLPALASQTFRNLGALEMEIAIGADRLAGGSRLVRQLLLSTPQADRSCLRGDSLPGQGRVGFQKQSVRAVKSGPRGKAVRRSSPASTTSAPSAE